MKDNPPQPIITGLKSFVEQLIRLEEIKASFEKDSQQIYLQAKIRGLDVKALHQLVKLHLKRAPDASYKDQTHVYKAAFEAELYDLFKTDPERLKREHFDYWIQWAHKDNS